MQNLQYYEKNCFGGVIENLMLKVSNFNQKYVESIFEVCWKQSKNNQTDLQNKGNTVFQSFSITEA